MTSLYILNNPSLYDDCINQLEPDDGLLLFEDAVIMANELNSPRLGFVLKEDLLSRGLESSSGWKTIDYDEFVELTISFDKTISWL